MKVTEDGPGDLPDSGPDFRDPGQFAQRAGIVAEKQDAVSGREAGERLANPLQVSRALLLPGGDLRLKRFGQKQRQRQQGGVDADQVDSLRGPVPERFEAQVFLAPPQAFQPDSAALQLGAVFADLVVAEDEQAPVRESPAQEIRHSFDAFEGVRIAEADARRVAAEVSVGDDPVGVKQGHFVERVVKTGVALVRAAVPEPAPHPVQAAFPGSVGERSVHGQILDDPAASLGFPDAEDVKVGEDGDSHDSW